MNGEVEQFSDVYAELSTSDMFHNWDDHGGSDQCISELHSYQVSYQLRHLYQ